MTPELLKTAEEALEKLAGMQMDFSNLDPKYRARSRPAAPVHVTASTARLNKPMKPVNMTGMSPFWRTGVGKGLRDLGSAPGKLFSGLFNTAKGNALLTAGLGYFQMAEQMGPRAMAKFKMASVNSNNGSKPMRTLKDVLVEKIAAAKRPNTQPSNLPFTVGQADVDFISKVAAAAMPNEMEKTAASTPVNWLSEAAKGAMPALNLAGLGALTGMAASGLYDRASDYFKRNSAYEQMFNEFPMLNEVPREQVDKFWGVLNDFAPKLATNPIVAGQFVENMLNYGVKGIDHNVAQQLLQSEATARNAGGRDIFELLSTIGKSSLDAGAKAMGGGGDDR